MRPLSAHRVSIMYMQPILKVVSRYSACGEEANLVHRYPVCSFLEFRQWHRGGRERSPYTDSSLAKKGSLLGEVKAHQQFATYIYPHNQGISDAPAWIVSQCNKYALDHGKSPFAIYQGAWSVMSRDFERDIIPTARMEGLFS